MVGRPAIRSPSASSMSFKVSLPRTPRKIGIKSHQTDSSVPLRSPDRAVRVACHGARPRCTRPGPRRSGRNAPASPCSILTTGSPPTLSMMLLMASSCVLLGQRTSRMSEPAMLAATSGVICFRSSAVTGSRRGPATRIFGLPRTKVRVPRCFATVLSGHWSLPNEPPNTRGNHSRTAHPQG